jgi:hypothetical protein
VRGHTMRRRDMSEEMNRQRALAALHKRKG